MTAITRFSLCPPRLALNLVFEGEDGKGMCAKIKYYIYINYMYTVKCSKMQIEVRRLGIILTMMRTFC